MKVGVSKASPKRTIGEWLTLSGYNCLAIADADGLLKASCTKPSVIVTARCPLVVRHDSSASFGFAICTFSTPKCDVALVIRHLDCQSDSSGLPLIESNRQSSIN
jgi:hypothetical protein